MQDISILLAKYAKLKPRDTVVREAFEKTFKHFFGGVDIPAIKIKSSEVIVAVSGPLKSEMLLVREHFNDVFISNLGEGIGVDRVS